MRGFAATVADLAMPSPVAADGPAPVAEPLTTLVAPATDTDRAVVAEVKPAG